MNEFVKPIAFIEADTDTNRIKRHIIDNPGAIVRDIVTALEIPEQQVRNAVVRLNMNGYIRRQAPEPGEKRVRWEEGADEKYNKRIAEFGKPRQITVSEWTPHLVRGEMETFLFGPAKT
jgi:DNA-binding MarR family transcriptional regulator